MSPRSIPTPLLNQFGRKFEKLKARKPPPKTHLKKNTILISDTKEQGNYLAESFSKNSSSQNYSKSFQKTKDRKERNPPNFFSDNTENYNKPFLLNELKDALNKSNETAAGPDGLYYQFLTHLPQDCLKILLQLLTLSGCLAKSLPHGRRPLWCQFQSQTRTYPIQPITDR